MKDAKTTMHTYYIGTDNGDTIEVKLHSPKSSVMVNGQLIDDTALDAFSIINELLNTLREIEELTDDASTRREIQRLITRTEKRL